MRYVIYGAGGIGAGIGAQLHAAGLPVVLIARGEHRRRIAEDGLRVEGPDESRLLRLRVEEHPEAVDWRAGDVALLTMKSQDTAAALVALRAAAGAALPVVSVQNGVANEAAALRYFEQVYGVLVFMPATFTAPGVVLLHGSPRRGVLPVGCYPKGVDPLAERIAADLGSAGFASWAESNVMPLKYGKLLLNLGNAAQALCGLEADLKPLTRALRQEAMACLGAAGIEFRTAGEVVTICAGHYTFGAGDDSRRVGGSTWQSLARGRREVEADWLNGEIVQLGALHGVPTPLNRSLRDLVVAAAAAGRAPGGAVLAEIWAAAKVEPPSVE